jgi:hypothetical protein
MAESEPQPAFAGAPDEAARTAMNAFYAARRRNPGVVPYIGPEDTLNRFLSGDVVTQRDLVTDQSLFTIQAILPAQMKRLRWMLDNLDVIK